MKKGINKCGQVWIETVIYTLIAFVMIGLVLSFVKPKIEEVQDKAIIEQSIRIIDDLNAIILSIVQGGAGNTREITLSMKKGILRIDGVNDKVTFEMDSKYVYSQPGEDVYYGNIIVRTERVGKYNKIILTSSYSGQHNLTYKGKDELKSLNKASTPYRLLISNRGGATAVIDMEIL